jgi:hypothetical protein
MDGEKSIWSSGRLTRAVWGSSLCRAIRNCCLITGPTWETQCQFCLLWCCSNSSRRASIAGDGQRAGWWRRWHINSLFRTGDAWLRMHIAIPNIILGRGHCFSWAFESKCCNRSAIILAPSISKRQKRSASMVASTAPFQSVDKRQDVNGSWPAASRIHALRAEDRSISHVTTYHDVGGETPADWWVVFRDGKLGL